MKKSTKAALLSGLVFPGVGHLFLKQYLRASVLVLSSLIASSIIINAAVDQAQAIVDRINSGDIPVDADAIAEMVSNSGNGADGLLQNIAAIVLLVVWLLGIVDSYRLGAAHDN